MLWYSLETRHLVEAQRRSTEIDRHPWLLALTLKTHLIGAEGDFPLGAEHLWLPIRNVGASPAFDVRVDLTGTVDGEAVETETFLKQRLGRIIVPNDTLHFEDRRRSAAF
jgi:hypothetical protein